jgi:Predicted transcriptional regulators
MSNMLDPIELLDILGNENRRRILQLLSFRPFYFNEMAKRLDVGPKAVIDHLEMLERAGLVECYQEEGRRKYFRIARRTVLEVAVSPHSYGVRAYLSEDAPKDDSGFEEAEASLDLKMLKDELLGLEKKGMSCANYWPRSNRERWRSSREHPALPDFGQRTSWSRRS